MVTATTSTDFVGLLLEGMYVGKDKESDTKNRLVCTKAIFSDIEDRISDTVQKLVNQVRQ